MHSRADSIHGCWVSPSVVTIVFFFQKKERKEKKNVHRVKLEGIAAKTAHCTSHVTIETHSTHYWGEARKVLGTHEKSTLRALAVCQAAY